MLENNKIRYSEDKKYDYKKISIKVALIYLFIGVLWILMSDMIVSIVIKDKDVMTSINMIKGWGYVLVSGILIYSLTYLTLKKVSDKEIELRQSYQELLAANVEIEAANSQLAASKDLLKQQYQELLVNQQKLMESERRYRLITEAANDAIWEEQNNHRKFSARWYEITGYNKEDLEVIESWETLLHPEDKNVIQKIIFEHKKNKTPFYQCEYRLKTKDGQYKWIQERGKALFDEKGISYYLVGSHTDITEVKEYEQKLHHLAYHDQLTGLKNRNSFTNTLVKLMSQEHPKKIGLLFVDIDNFKYINDSMGHTFGDLILKEMGQRLVNYQNEQISIYRLGGDEYIILIEGFEEISAVEKLAVNVLRDLNKAIEINKSFIFITASIGISIFPEHGKNIDELLKNADIAVFRAKEAGKNKIIIFNEPMNEAVTERAQIEKHLRTALEKNEFELYYQPQLDINTNKISGFEALLRWKNPELGFVPPNKFIGVAEDTHLIIPIGEWVLRNSCMFLKHLHDRGYTDLTMSINISMLQLLQDDFVDMVTDTLELVKINPKDIELEITESILMESYETIALKLKLLKAIGVKIALDDFGKGYSSLHYLKHLPISTLKIDKTFIDNISLDKRNKSLTHLMVKIGRVMDLCVVAEGVETEEQMEYLKKYKCNKIQGYLFCKPLPYNEIFKKLEVNQ